MSQEKQIIELPKKNSTRRATIKQRQIFHNSQNEAARQSEEIVSQRSFQITGLLIGLMVLMTFNYEELMEYKDWLLDQSLALLPTFLENTLFQRVFFCLLLFLPPVAFLYPLVKKILKNIYFYNQPDTIKKALKQNFQDRELSFEEANNFIQNLENYNKPRFSFYSLASNSLYILSATYFIFIFAENHVGYILHPIFISSLGKNALKMAAGVVFMSFSLQKVTDTFSILQNIFKDFRYGILSIQDIKKVLENVSEKLPEDMKINVAFTKHSAEIAKETIKSSLLESDIIRDILFLKLNLQKKSKNMSSKTLLTRYLWAIAITQTLSQQHFEVATANETQFLVTLDKNETKASDVKLDIIKKDLLNSSEEIQKTVDSFFRFHGALSWIIKKFPDSYWKLIFVSGKKIDAPYSLELQLVIKDDELNKKCEIFQKSLQELDFLKDKVENSNNSIVIRDINTIKKVSKGFYRYAVKEIKNNISGSTSSDNTPIPSSEDLKNIEFYDNGGFSWLFPKKRKNNSTVKIKIKTRGTPISKKNLPLTSSLFSTPSNATEYVDFILGEEQKHVKKKYFNPLDKGKNNESKTKFTYLDKNSKEIKKMKKNHPIEYNQLKSTTLEAESIGVDSKNIKGTKWIKKKNIAEIKLAGNSARFWGTIYKGKFNGKEVKIAHIYKGDNSHKGSERALGK